MVLGRTYADTDGRYIDDLAQDDIAIMWGRGVGPGLGLITAIGIGMHVAHPTTIAWPSSSSQNAKDPSHELSNGMMVRAWMPWLASPDTSAVLLQRNIMTQWNNFQWKCTLGYLLPPQAWAERHSPSRPLTGKRRDHIVGKNEQVQRCE